MEYKKFLESTSQRDTCTAIPDDIVDFLIWKDSFGKTVVPFDTCPLFGEKRILSCSCHKRLAYGSVDSVIGKLKAIFNKYGRPAIDSPFPGLANPAASTLVKSYLSAIREEQLAARVVPKQAEPFFFQDLVILSSEIIKHLKVQIPSPSQLFILARDEAFFKVQFFGGDRAGDLGRLKTKEILCFPGREGLLFNHTLTKSLQGGTSVMQTSVCPVTAVEVYISLCNLLKIPVRQGFLFRPLNPLGEVIQVPFDSAVAQARFSIYASRYQPLLIGASPYTACEVAVQFLLQSLEQSLMQSWIKWVESPRPQHVTILN